MARSTVPIAVAEAIAAIAKLPLPSTDYEAALRHKEYEYEKARAEHKRLAAILKRYMARRFRKALGSAYSIDVEHTGYVLDWGYRPDPTKERPFRVPTRPMVGVRVGFPHGYALSGTIRTEYDHAGAGRCVARLTYFPHDGMDLAAWCDSWIAWIRLAPPPGKPANLQVDP